MSDRDFREAQREAKTGDPDAINYFLSIGIRNHLIPDDVIKILAAAGDHVAQSYFDVEWPDLYFITGIGDPFHQRETSRIRWLEQTQQSSAGRHLWFKIITQLLLNAWRQQILPFWNRFMSGNEPLLYPRPARNLWKAVDKALQYLQSVGPNNPPQKVDINAFIIQFDSLASLTSDEGQINWTTLEGPDAQSIWREQRNYQSMIYNMVEILHHIFLAFSGSGGISSDSEDYTGSPFLVHWQREHGTLNPGNHLADLYRNTVRLSELIDPQSKQINWSVVTSNALVALFFIWVNNQALSGHSILYLSPMDAPLSFRVDVEKLQIQLNQATAQKESLLQNIPEYSEIQSQIQILTADDEYGIPADDDFETFEHLVDQLQAIADATPEAEILTQRIEELSRQIMRITEDFILSLENNYMQGFWDYASPIIREICIQFAINSC